MAKIYTNRTSTLRRSRGTRSRCSGSAARGTRTRRTCVTRGTTSAWGCARARRAGPPRRMPGYGRADGGRRRRGRRGDGAAPGHVARSRLRAGRRRDLKAGDMLMFAHGFSVHFGTVRPPADVDVTMIAPKVPGTRAAHVRGGHRHARAVAVQQDASGAALAGRSPTARASAPRVPASSRPRSRGDRDRPVRGADGAVRGISSLVEAGFETLVEAGYQPESRTSSACTSSS